MNKHEFLFELRKGLSGLPQEDIDERINFYSEMIDDRMEEGLSEEDAVSDIGSVDEIVSQIVAETPLLKIVKDKMKSRKKMQAWEIVLLILGAPIWLSLLIAVIAGAFSVYAVLWSVVVAFWSMFGAFAGVGIGGIGGGIALAVTSNVWRGCLLISAGLLCAGLSIFAFFGCKAATKGMVFLTKKIAWVIKKCFVKKEGAV